MIGEQLGPYRVEEKIGEGGMGQVYQATDTKLNRQVALKILPEAFAEDPDRLARFQREAQVLASLNHPNIGGIHGLEDSDGVRALVLEYIEGPTLADRIAQGPIPVDEALPIAKQIAEALEAAHEQGVIHRDLKPANIKLKPDGTVKVLDFGLAKALDTAPEGDPSQSPTLTAAATQMGVIMGTAAYMSPEQARGKPVDKRADVWAFGAVVYEMLTGERAFGGDDVSLTLAKVLEREPVWASLPGNTPPHLRNLLQRCLEKQTRQRVQAVGDVRLAMDGMFQAVPSSAPPEWRFWQTRSFAALALLGLTVTASFVVAGLTSNDQSTGTVARYAVPLPPGQQLTDSRIALSPDGNTLVYSGLQGGGSPQLFRRRASELEPQAIAGTEGAEAPFFSPTGAWVGFVADGQLKRVGADGGPVIPIVDVAQDTYWGGASWGIGDRIVFSQHGPSGLQSVSADGGPLEDVALPNEAIGENSYISPHILPGGDAVLFTIWTGSIADAKVGVQSLAGGSSRVLVDGFAPVYLEPGYLVFVRDSTLWAVSFDVDDLALTGSPVPFASVATQGLTLARAPFAVAAEAGSLVYRPSSAVSGRELLWVSRTGEEVPLGVAPRDFLRLNLSPSGDRLAVEVDSAGRPQIWAYDLQRGSETLVTSYEARFPIWAADEERIVFASDQLGDYNVYTTLADGTGTPSELIDLAGSGFPRATPWSTTAVGSRLVFRAAGDVWMLLPEGEPFAILTGDANERYPSFSPEGNWLLYTSDESGRTQVYVQPYPHESGRRIPVSVDGGSMPLWSPDGEEIFYWRGDQLLTVPVRTGRDLEVGTPRVLFSGPYLTDSQLWWSYDVHPDGQRFVVIREKAYSPTQLIAVQNWTEELNRLVPIN